MNNTEILKTSIVIKNSDVIKYFLIETQFNKSIFKWSLLEFRVLTIDKSQPAEYQIYCYDFSESAFKFQFQFEHFRYYFYNSTHTTHKSRNVTKLESSIFVLGFCNLLNRIELQNRTKHRNIARDVWPHIEREKLLKNYKTKLHSI